MIPAQLLLLQTGETPNPRDSAPLIQSTWQVSVKQSLSVWREYQASRMKTYCLRVAWIQRQELPVRFADVQLQCHDMTTAIYQQIWCSRLYIP